MPPKVKKASLSRVTKPERKQPTRKSLREKTTTAAAAESATMPVTTIKTTASDEQKDENKPVYFWRPHDGNGYLGQWYPSQFTVDGETYATAEMWMMVQKARLFEDEDIAKKMLATTDPKTHKALGRQVDNFNDKTWNEHKLRIVTEGNYHKFTISDDSANLKGMLLATGERDLVEASPMDRIWGIGFGEKNAGKNRHRWGQNLLGKALMAVREKLGEDGKGEGKVVG